MILIYLAPCDCDHGQGLLTPMLDRKIQYPSPPRLFVNLLYVNLSSMKVLVIKSHIWKYVKDKLKCGPKD